MTGFLENFCRSDFPSLNLTVENTPSDSPSCFGTISKRPKETTSQLTGKKGCNYRCITITQTQPCVPTFVPTKPSAHHVVTYLAIVTLVVPQGTSALASPDGWPVDAFTTLRGAKWESWQSWGRFWGIQNHDLYHPVELSDWAHHPHHWL